MTQGEPLATCMGMYAIGIIPIINSLDPQTLSTCGTQMMPMQVQDLVGYVNKVPGIGRYVGYFSSKVSI